MGVRLKCSASAIAFALFSLAQADEKASEDWYGPKPLKGNYQVYGGSLSDMVPPTSKDRKVSIRFTGQFAKDLFNQIAPDVKKVDSCSSAADFRERRRGDIDCVFTKADGYICYLGLDVSTGKSTDGIIC
jgi:hypothetical protein